MQHHFGSAVFTAGPGVIPLDLHAARTCRPTSSSPSSPKRPGLMRALGRPLRPQRRRPAARMAGPSPRRGLHRHPRLLERLPGRHRRRCSTGCGTGLLPMSAMTAMRERGPQWTALKEADRHPLVRQADWITVPRHRRIREHPRRRRNAPGPVAALPEATAIPLTWRLFGNAGVVGVERQARHQHLHPRGPRRPALAVARLAVQDALPQ